VEAELCDYSGASLSRLHATILQIGDLRSNSDENFAIELGKRYNEIAIFNLEDAREVFTGGTGENISSLPSIEKRLKELKYGNPIN
jgi:hypothetical protein